jgi:SM-20-related protein
MTGAAAALRQSAPHIIIHGFLGEVVASRIMDFATANECRFIPSGLGVPADKIIDPTMRRSRRMRLGEMRGELKERFGAVLPEAVAALGMPVFDLASLELELVAHEDGAFFRRHIDTYTGPRSLPRERMISAVYYVHNRPKAFTGGDLRLHSIVPAEAGGSFFDIAVEHDMLLLFPSWLPHEVLPVSVPSGRFADARFAINCWYHRSRTT